ncbi:multidrug resistance efflux pump [Bradyrhizobium sp. USDA 4369]
MQQARAQLDQANLNLQYTNVTAAEQGRVVKLSAAKGRLPRPGRA